MAQEPAGFVANGFRQPLVGFEFTEECADLQQVARAFPGGRHVIFIWWASVSVLEIRLASRSCVGRITDPSRVPCGSVVG